MLYWICPECGRECQPAIRECPSCADALVSSAAATHPDQSLTEGVLALVRSVQDRPPVLITEPVPEPALVMAIRSNEDNGAVQPGSAAIENGSRIAENGNVESVVRPLVESAVFPQPAPEPIVWTSLARPVPEPLPAIAGLPQPPEMTNPPSGPVPGNLVQPSFEPAARPDFSLPFGRIEKLGIPAVEPFRPPVWTAPVASGPSSATAAPERPSLLASPEPYVIELPEEEVEPEVIDLVEPDPPVEDLFQDLPLEGLPLEDLPFVDEVPPPVFELVAESEPQYEPAEPEIEVVSEPIPGQGDLFAESESPVARVAEVEFPPVSDALELQSYLLLETITQQLATEESAIRAVMATFEQRPACALLAEPSEILEAPAPPLWQPVKLPRPAISAKRGVEGKLSVSLVPQPLTLPGPYLPRELQEFTSSVPRSSQRPHRRNGIPTWLVSVIVATTLFLGAGSAIQYLTGDKEAKAAPVTTTPAAAVPTGEPHAMARFVEVTGLRVIADLKHRSQVHYLVVNHSANPLTGVVLRIDVRSSAGPEYEAPLFSLSTVIPNLAPYQSKEIRADIDKDLRSASIPEWQNLRTDVQVTSQ